MLKIRCSQLGNIMTLPRAKKDQDKLSQGAMTYLTQLAKEYVYDYQNPINSKYIEKGNECEQDSIDLLNELMIESGEFVSYEKNDIRYENSLLTGEMDIVAVGQKLTRDTKTSWNLDSFPSTVEEALNQSSASMYEWQGRGYMLLLNEHGIEINHHIVDYCLVDTPDRLISAFDDSLHTFSHYPTKMRVTSVKYERCIEKEEMIRERVRLAQDFLTQTVFQIYLDHGYSVREINEIMSKVEL